MDEPFPSGSSEAAAPRALAGTFTALVLGGPCQLVLTVGGDRRVAGRLELAGEIFAIRGVASRTGDALYGFLLDPVSSVPVALLRARPAGEAMVLELDVPEFEASAPRHAPLRILFGQVPGPASKRAEGR